MKNQKLVFPKNFLWGTSTSAYQVEGGIVNDWSEWENSKKRKKELKKQNKNPKDFKCGMACDSYGKYKEDAQLVKDLHCGGYRMSIEWARIEPQKGEFDKKEIKHYRHVLQELRKKKIKTVVTLWHWTNPIWLSDNGGWLNPDVVKRFEIYVEKIVYELGDLVDFWVTLNEPMIHVFNGYVIAKFPPAQKNVFKANKVFLNLVKAHKSAYEIIHEKYDDAQVSITQIVNYFEPAKTGNRHRKSIFSKNPILHGVFVLNKILVKFMNYFWNERFLKKTEDYLDYIGLDYYFHDRLSVLPPFKVNENKKINDMGWEIYPKGIYYVLKDLKKFNKPIFILENGLADEKDHYRKDFTLEHLKNVHRAIQEGVDVKGYFHWSLLDNFEWAEGFEPKFGLYEVDKNMNRIQKKSARIYADICRNNFVICGDDSEGSGVK